MNSNKYNKSYRGVPRSCFLLSIHNQVQYSTVAISFAMVPDIVTCVTLLKRNAKKVKHVTFHLGSALLYLFLANLNDVVLGKLFPTIRPLTDSPRK